MTNAGDPNAPAGKGVRTGASGGDGGAEGGGLASAAKRPVAPTAIVRERNVRGGGADGPTRATTGELSGTTPPSSVVTLGDRQRRQRRLLLAFCALSLGAHIGLVVGWAFAPKPGRAAVDLDEAIVKTRLVKLGKERPPDWLPRLDAAPSQPIDKKHAKPEDEKPKPDKQDKDSKDKPTAADILKDFDKDNRPKDLNDIIKDRIGQQTDEGKKDGDKDGSALDGEIKKTYFNTLSAHIKRFLENSDTLTDDDRIRLRAVLAVKVDADGNVVDAKIQTSSGNSRYDNDVVLAAKRSSPAPAPPPAVRDLAASGMAFNMCPISCK